MNPLGNGNLNNQTYLSPQLQQGIQQVKSMMQLANGKGDGFLQMMGQQNPMLNQVLQMCKGQNPKDVFMSMCKQQGIDPDAVIKALQQ